MKPIPAAQAIKIMDATKLLQRYGMINVPHIKRIKRALIVRTVFPINSSLDLISGKKS